MGPNGILGVLISVHSFAIKNTEPVFCDNVIDTIINKSEKVKDLKNRARDRRLTTSAKTKLIEEEKEYKSKPKLVQKKLIKFATRVPAYISD